MEEMLSEKKTVYIKFVKETIYTNMYEILNEYHELTLNDITEYKNNKHFTNINDIVREIVIQSLDKYTGTSEQFNYLQK
jgi:hypothetical protein